MANWKFKLNVSEPWRKAQSGEISPNELSSEIAKLLKPLLKYIDALKGYENVKMELDDIIEVFEEEAKDESMTSDAFDSLWNELYNWADNEVPPFGEYPHNKLCWIQTS